MDFLKDLEKKGVLLPSKIKSLLNDAPKVTFFNTTDELVAASTNGLENDLFEVKYDVPGKGEYLEAVVHKISNGISANYTEAYMRRRDPDTMLIADDKPTDKPRFNDLYSYGFSSLQDETFAWLKNQRLGVFLYYAGSYPVGVAGIAIVPDNAGFFALGLALLQKMININELPENFRIQSAIYVAPPFRHTHFDGKQKVIHNRLDGLHEIYSYNLYPGPSAKKGLYAALLDEGENEGWVTTHCSTVTAISPYDNSTNFMHEGASGGGKSEMLQMILRETNGQVKIGQNMVTGEQRLINIPLFCTTRPVTDDMALCHPSYQKGNGKLTLSDAENGWFMRVDGVKGYGDDPFLEKMTMSPSEPLLFLNIATHPHGTAMIWNHIEDEPGKPCPNPRVVIPRHGIPDVVNKPVTVDVRSFGVRTPPCSLENPSYGILGIFHILPPALAWLWRLVSPRGYANPSISGSEEMASEGVGSYWPFATGKKITHANLLLEQIINSPRVRYTLTPNQHIGVWKVGFKPQLIMREYLTRRGNSKLRSEQYQPARSPLLGYELNYITIEGAKIPSRFLKVYKQSEVGEEGYDKGAEILYNFFRKELQQYLQPELLPLGRKIIEACLNGASVDEYNELLPMEFKHAFFKKNK